MGEVIHGGFRRDRGERFICTAISEEGTPCVQLMNEVVVGGAVVTNAQKITLCAASLTIADELASHKACGFQKFTEASLDDQNRIQRIAEGSTNAT